MVEVVDCTKKENTPTDARQASFEVILDKFYRELKKLDDNSIAIENGVVRLNDFREASESDCDEQQEPAGIVDKLFRCLLRFSSLNENLKKSVDGLNEIV